MNLYIRYFNDEIVATSVEDALDFIRGIQGFAVTPQFEADFRQYAEGNLPYPKRYKVRTRVYFIVIKTTATNLTEFKANGKGGQAIEEGDVPTDFSPERPMVRLKQQMQLRLTDEMPGWYEGAMRFKRVVRNSITGKFNYLDTTFVARVKAHNPMECYERIIDHLRTRSDVDPRSQFPSIKGKNFRYTYLGIKPYTEINV